MKNIPLGKWALSLPKTGHEMFLHGFLQKVKPFTFIMCDTSWDKKNPFMMYTQRCLGNIYKTKDCLYVMLLKDLEAEKNAEEKMKEEEFLYYVREPEIQNDLAASNMGFLERYVNDMVNRLIEKKIDHIVCCQTSEKDITNEICKMATTIAVKYVNKFIGKKITMYEYNAEKKFDSDIDDNCIHIKLSEEETEKKISAFANHHLDILDLYTVNIPVNKEAVDALKQKEGGLKEAGDFLKSINPSFFSDEYLLPFKKQTIRESKLYESYGKKLEANLHAV